MIYLQNVQLGLYKPRDDKNYFYKGRHADNSFFGDTQLNLPES
jgi:hypothetical protein